MSQESRLHGLIERLSEEYVRRLRLLVSTPSVTGSESSCQELVRGSLEDLGVAVHAVVASNTPPFHRTGREYEGRPSLVGRIPGKGSAHFVLNAHLDTAPVEDASTWLHPPYAAVVDGGRLYGRGALDDKAGIAMMLMLAEAFVRADVCLPGDLLLESVIEDEDSGNGTLACLEAGFHCEGAIVIDGTWPLRVIDSHLGQMWLDIEVGGVAAAACSHRRGLNPIHQATRVMQALDSLVGDLNQGVLQWLNIETPYFASVGAISGGAWPGAVPEKCQLRVQVGFPPPESPQGMLERVTAAVVRSVSDDARASVRVEVRELFVAPFSNRENRMVRVVRDTVQRLRPQEGPFLNNAVTGHCDLRHLRQADGRPAHACLYGPGGGGNPHIKDEFYLLEHFVPVAQNIASSILAFYDQD